MIERIKSLIREIKGVLISPVYCVESTFRSGTLKVYWKGSKNFHMPEFLLSIIWCWVHEFSEETITDLVPGSDTNMIGMSLLGCERYASISHLMTSLHLPSVTRVWRDFIVIQPETFEESVPWRRHRD